MAYIKLLNNGDVDRYPYTIEDLKNENKNTSFPEVISQSTLLSYNIHLVNPPINFKPLYNKKYIEVMPICISGSYFQNYIEQDLSSEELESNRINEWDGVRIRRNKFLLDSDWTQLSDSPLSESKKSEWSIYRQSLRDITLQEDPFNIVWPTKPE